MNYLSDLSQALQRLRCYQELDSACQAVIDLAQHQSFYANPTLETVALMFLMKIREICPDDELSPSMKDLLVYFYEKKALDGFVRKSRPEFFEKVKGFLEERRLRGSPKPSHQDSDNLRPKKNAKEDSLLKQVGIAILDLNGDILFADQVAEKHFEIKQKDLVGSNLFRDLMIPFSRSYLKKKFGKEGIFSKQENFESPLNFTYVIYSPSSANKFIRQLQSKKIRKLDEIEQKNEPEDRDSSIYLRFLKALSSKATLSRVDCYRSEIADVVMSKKQKLQTSNPPSQTQAAPNHRRVSSFESQLQGGDKISDLFKSESDIGRKGSKISKEKEKEKIEFVILLETRSAKTIPKFPYSRMEGDPRIRDLQEKIDKKFA